MTRYDVDWMRLTLLMQALTHRRRELSMATDPAPHVMPYSGSQPVPAGMVGVSTLLIPPPWSRTSKRPWRAPASKAVVFHHVSCSFSISLCRFIALFLSVTFPTSLCRCCALQGAGFMSWWGFGVFAGKSDSKTFFIAYTAIHHYSAFPAQ